MNEFKDYNLKPYLYKALDFIHFKNPTQVQEMVIPSVLSGESLMVESATGSGKTHAFLIPILQNMDVTAAWLQAVR